MKRPIDSLAYCCVEYPSAIFSLEVHESYPYERFAHNVLRIGVEALHKKDLPERIHITFSKGAVRDNWWVFAASIGRLDHYADTDLKGFHVSTTPFAPLLLWGISHFSATSLFQADEAVEHEPMVAELQSFLANFGSHYTQAVRTYKSHGLASSVREFVRLRGISLSDVNRFITTFDCVSKFIANHEVAHAYVGQLTTPGAMYPSRDRRAFEVLVDILATEWIYHHMIVNTPDSETYRELRGAESYEQCIYDNAIWVLESQTVILLVLAIASALSNNGRITLDGGPSHPNSLVRWMLQGVHFGTLLKSNYSGVLSHEQFEDLDRHWHGCLGILAGAGLFCGGDMQRFADPGVEQDLLRAYELVEEYDIRELYKSREVLRMVPRVARQAGVQDRFGFEGVSD